MLNITDQRASWPEHLKPIGEGFNQEKFPAWWKRNGDHLSHLEPRIAEQWVHRHWDYTPYQLVPLDRLSWRLDRWSAGKILSDVYVPNGELNAEWDYEVFIERVGTPTGRPFVTTGTWDFPIIILEVPTGVCSWSEERPDVRHLLIEGHLRRRCLNAMMVHDRAASEHEVFVLDLKSADDERPQASQQADSEPAS